MEQLGAMVSEISDGTRGPAVRASVRLQPCGLTFECDSCFRDGTIVLVERWPWNRHVEVIHVDQTEHGFVHRCLWLLSLQVA